jgi:metal-sulfur cluster biosynthetic enzyme
MVRLTTLTLVSYEREITKRTILKILHKIKDPGVPMTLEEMGIISEKWIHIDGDLVHVEFRPSSPYCPVGLAIGVVVKDTLEKALGTEVEVKVLRGSHLQESLVNELLRDRQRFMKALDRLKTSGFVTRCKY